MATANQICSAIFDEVNNSSLDFKMNQTPYSIHFSIRKKFSKYSSPPVSSSLGLSSSSVQDVLQQELLHVRNEYVKLYSLYETEKQRRSKLENDFDDALEKIAAIEKNENDLKVLKNENRKLTEKVEIKYIECKQLKCEIENLQKEKCVLSVALKASKKDSKEQSKSFEKKQVEMEKKLLELNNFKNKKLSEQREETLRKRKELKKSIQKSKQRTRDDESCENNNFGENNYLHENANEGFDDEKLEQGKTELNQMLENCTVEKNPNEDKDTLVNESKEAEEGFEEENELFIGPKLPKLMSKEEIEEFQKELFAKLDMKIKLSGIFKLD